MEAGTGVELEERALFPEPEGGSVPRPKRPETPAELGFERQGPIGWMGPRLLASAALEVAISGLFGRFADKRETEATLPPRIHVAEDRDEDETFRLDFAADTGDGVDATYAIAWLLAQEELTSRRPRRGEPKTTRRGDVLVLGGDQVYPSASWEHYHDRFVGPYRAALPFVPAEDAPRVFALPGNHDWYDGLTSFMRLFAREGWIGGWKTEQARSYFAIKLPHGWWLWGIDTQLDVHLDGAQLDYFAAVREKLAAGDRIILATAKPSWVHVEDDPSTEVPQSWRTLAFFEQEFIANAKVDAEVALTLTGDLHHYARYEDGSGRQKVTSGGAGAYLSATHWLPSSLSLPDQADLARDGREGSTAIWGRVTRWPRRRRSRQLRPGVFGLVLDIPGLGAFVGTLYLLLALAIAHALDGGESFAGGEWPAFWALAGNAVSFWGILLVLALFGALFGLASSRETRPRHRGLRLAIAALHLLAHLALAVIATILVVAAVAEERGEAIPSALLLPVLIVPFAVGWLGGKLVLATYLFTANALDPNQNANELMAAQSKRTGPGFKHFVRIEIAPGGKLTATTIGMKRPPRWAEWRLDPDAEGAGTGQEPSWLCPPDGGPGTRVIDEFAYPPEPPPPS